MGNSVNQERMFQLQMRIIQECTDLKIDRDVTLKNVPIDNYSSLYLHTMIIDRKGESESCQKKETMVIIHGYGGSGTCFYRVFNELSIKFRLILVDLLGQGQSARPTHLKNKFQNNLQLSEDFFVESLERWRERMELTDFILMGHSLGGYIASIYALKHQQHIKKLLLLSPAGYGYKPDDFELRKYVTKFGGYFKQQQAKWICNQWASGNSVFDYFRTAGTLVTNKVLDEYMRHRMPNLPEHERELFRDYLVQIFLQQGSSEYAANQILLVGGFARSPLPVRFSEIKIPITFMFGDKDWMHREGAYEIKEKRICNSEINIVILENCCHQMHLDNPPVVTTAILQDLQQYYS